MLTDKIKSITILYSLYSKTPKETCEDFLLYATESLISYESFVQALKA